MIVQSFSKVNPSIHKSRPGDWAVKPCKGGETVAAMGKIPRLNLLVGDR